MSSRISIFDYNGNKLAELDGVPSTRSWTRSALPDVGRCQFPISLADPKCSERILRYGNLIRVEHIPSVDENGTARGKLPDWVGWILPPRDWGRGTVTITAFAAESILSYRGMPFDTVTGSPAYLFNYILDCANTLVGFFPGGGAIIQPGTVNGGIQLQRMATWDGGTTLSIVMNSDALTHVKDLIAKCGYDWNVTGQVDVNGKLNLFGNWFSKFGTDTGVNLNDDNHKLESSNLLSEVGPIYNAVYGVSEANTNARFDTSKNDPTSISQYGLLHTIQTFTSNTKNDCDAGGAEFIRNNSQPRYIVRPTALDRGALFSALAVGNTLNYSTGLSGFLNGGLGFQQPITISSMTYDDLKNEVQITAKA